MTYDNLLKKVKSLLRDLREIGKNGRLGTYENLFYELNDNLPETLQESQRSLKYVSKLKLRTSKCDAFLIIVVNQVFGVYTPDADIVLMSLGLLEGYSYRTIYSHIDRRKKFLKNSPYLGVNGERYNGNDEKANEKCETTFRKDRESPRIDQLAKFLVDKKKHINDIFNEINSNIDDYIDKKGFAILQAPSYIEGKPLRDRKKRAVITFSISKRELFTTSSDIIINEDDGYEMAVDLPEDVDLHKKRKISTLATFIFVLFFTSLSITTLIYTQKNTLDKSQDPNMENRPGDDTGREYQTKEDIMGVLERAEPKLETRPYALDSLPENGNTVSPL